MPPGSRMVAKKPFPSCVSPNARWAHVGCLSPNRGKHFSHGRDRLIAFPGRVWIRAARMLLWPIRSMSTRALTPCLGVSVLPA